MRSSPAVNAFHFKTKQRIVNLGRNTAFCLFFVQGIGKHPIIRNVLENIRRILFVISGSEISKKVFYSGSCCLNIAAFYLRPQLIGHASQINAARRQQNIAGINRFHILTVGSMRLLVFCHFKISFVQIGNGFFQCPGCLQPAVRIVLRQSFADVTVFFPIAVGIRSQTTCDIVQIFDFVFITKIFSS